MRQLRGWAQLEAEGPRGLGLGKRGRETGAGANGMTVHGYIFLNFIFLKRKC